MAADSLKEKTAKGLAWGSIGNGSQLLLGVVFGIVLARLLSPADYGMVGILQIFQPHRHVHTRQRVPHGPGQPGRSAA